MTNGTKVLKRNGKTESLDLDKIHVIQSKHVKDLLVCLLLR